MGFLVNALRARDWIVSFAQARLPVSNAALCYSYWIQPETLGSVLAKAQLPHMKVVSRVHGGTCTRNAPNRHICRSGR